MRIDSRAALLLLLCTPLFGQRIDDVPHAAAVTEMTPATLDELAREAVMTPLGEHREKPRGIVAAAKGGPGEAIVADLVSATGAAAAPPVTLGFRASFDPLPSATMVYDPADASGAVGPRHAVGAFNNSLSVHDRGGAQLSLLSIYQFWREPGITDTLVYDPRVIYDAANDRWVLAMLTDTNVRQGVLLFAVTATGDPTGTWRRFRIPISANPALTLDFTRMAMTLDQIVITANEYDGDLSTGVDVFTIPKATAYPEGTTPVPTKTRSGALFDITPVASADTAVRILTQEGDAIAQYQLAFGGLLATKRYVPPVSFGTGGAMCDQLGTTRPVDCGDSVLHYALLRDGVLWVVHSATDFSRSQIVVWKISGNAAKAFLIQDATTDYAYPSIAVNRLGAALVGYSMLNSSMYPSAAYCYIDPAGNVSAPAMVKSGEDWYSDIRWGDYSATVVDPLDDTSFWTLQSYGTPAYNGTTHGTWGTWWSYVAVRGPQRVRAVRH